MGPAIIAFVVIVGVGGLAFVALHLQNQAALEKQRIQAKAEAQRKLIRSRQSQLRDKLIDSLRDIATFDITKIRASVRLEEHEIDEVIHKIYHQLCRKYVQDGVLSDREQKKLKSVARALEISSEIAFDILNQSRNEKIDSILIANTEDGILTPEVLSELNALALSLGRANQEPAISKERAIDYFIRYMTRLISRGEPLPNLIENQVRYADELRLNEQEVTEAFQKHSSEILRQCVVEVCQDGEITENEQVAIQWLVSYIDPTKSNAEFMWLYDKLETTKRLHQLRSGILPSVETSRLLESGERCHYEGSCMHVYSTPKSGDKMCTGEIVVTSDRLLLFSSDRTFSLGVSNIFSVNRHHNRVFVETSSRHGSGYYVTSHPDVFEAVLVGVAKRSKYTLSTPFQDSLSRHIPDGVKREVWHRDQGRCVRCSSQQYLEYDHIIPHAKGGANTVGNVQLLCRGCNADKSDRI